MTEGPDVPFEDASSSDMVLASFSGGKDSTAMVLRMIERGDRLDQVVFCDTGMEFPAMYDHIQCVRDFVEAQGVEFVTLKPDHSFEWYLCKKEVDSKKHGHYSGYSWPNMSMRWCTKHLKTRVMDKYKTSLRNKLGRCRITTCTGLAADELNRLERPNNMRDRHPLVEWGWTEEVCLGYCYGRGFGWYDPSIGKDLYEIFDRTSCWICPLGTVDNFRQLRRWYPDLWEKIGDLERSIRYLRETEQDSVVAGSWTYTSRYSWQQLEDRFEREDLGVASATTLEDFL